MPQKAVKEILFWLAIGVHACLEKRNFIELHYYKKAQGSWTLSFYYLRFAFRLTRGDGCGIIQKNGKQSLLWQLDKVFL